MFKPEYIIYNNNELNPSKKMKDLFGYEDFYRTGERKVGTYKGSVYDYREVTLSNPDKNVIVSDRPNKGVTDLVKSIYPNCLYSNNLRVIKDKQGNDWAHYGLEKGGASFYKLPPIDNII